MLDPARIPPVAPSELLARFVLFSGHIRSSDNTVKPDAFMPHPHVELSLTRHLEATDDEIWQEGERVAAARGTLHGSADVVASAFLDESLRVEAKPIGVNPNHADATGWPPEKAEQKIKAISIARKCKLTRKRPA